MFHWLSVLIRETSPAEAVAHPLVDRSTLSQFVRLLQEADMLDDATGEDVTPVVSGS